MEFIEPYLPIGPVRDAIFGFNLGEDVVRAELGLALPALAESRRSRQRPRPRAMAGQVLIMKRPGLPRAVPDVPAEPWAEHFWFYVRQGQAIPPASGSSDFLTCAVTSAPTGEERERRLQTLGTRFEAQAEVAAAS